MIRSEKKGGGKRLPYVHQGGGKGGLWSSKGQGRRSKRWMNEENRERKGNKMADSVSIALNQTLDGNDPNEGLSADKNAPKQGDDGLPTRTRGIQRAASQLLRLGKGDCRGSSLPLTLSSGHVSREGEARAEGKAAKRKKSLYYKPTTLRGKKSKEGGGKT